MTHLRRARRAREHATDEGFALVAGLLTLLVASSIGATMAELARLETVLAHQRKAAAAALAAVDACAENAVASLPAGWEFTDVVLGSDGVAGTTDDGVVALAGNCTGGARAAPGAAAPVRLLLEVEATRGRGRRRLEAVVRRHTEPGAPALMWIADGAAVGGVTGSLMLDGIDATRPEPPRAMLAAPAEPDALDAWISAQGANVSAADGTGAPIWAVPPPLAALVAHAATSGAIAPETGLVPTPPAIAHVMLSAGDLNITGTRFGAGILIVDGVLQIAGDLTFTGVVVATGGLRVEPSGVVSVDGALWLGAASSYALAVDGSATIRASAEALEAADALLPLPRRATLAWVRDF